MVFKVLFWIAVGLECVFVPLFIKFQWPKKTKKSLLFKMLCSFLFVATALLAMKIAGNYSYYTRFVISALGFAFVGDFLLHVKESLLLRSLGMLSFACCHLLLTFAAIGIWPMLFPGVTLFRGPGLFMIEGLVVVVFVYGLVKKWSITRTILPFSIYMAFLASMFGSIGTLGIEVAKSGGPHHVVASILLIAGASCFLVSDLSLGLIYTSKKCRKSFPLKIFNTVTYFAAQMMLASSILFMNPA